MSDVEMSSLRYLSFNIFSGLMKTSARSFAAGGCYFFLDKKVTKKSSQSECFLPALPVLNAFLDVRRLTSCKKAKPAFPPYARPARSDIPRASFNSRIASLSHYSLLTLSC
jgi:hypothetical protein